MRKGMGVAAALLVVAMGACSQDTTQPGTAAGVNEVAAGDTVRLGVGQSARIGSTGVLIRFSGIAEDSRCPINALCVWPGTAEARLELSAPGEQPRSVGLHSYSEPHAVEYAGFRIHLLQVTPSRSTEETIDPDAYVIALEITRK
jgi:hypothetical protein